jgi:hydrogenase large subunit
VATVVPGGVTLSPSKSQMSKVKMLAVLLRSFVNDVYVPDALFLSRAYPDYFDVGRGSGNLLSAGVFDRPGKSTLFARGRIVGRHGGSLQPATGVLPLDTLKIAEDVSHSNYTDGAPVHPGTGATSPLLDKPGAYSWLKAPRYDGAVYEVGPLARLSVSRYYSGGVSVMDRVLARAFEARRVANALVDWAGRVVPGRKSYTRLGTISGTALGLTEAPRGALGHWTSFSAGKVGRYQIVTPTCWNGSPQDANGVSGAMEQALVGTPVADAARPVELMRVVHSFDPCTGCAVHAIDLSSGVEHEFIVGPAAAR